MLFNSLHFILFFLVVTVAYFVISHQWRWLWLLVASCYFYMVFVPVYMVILGATIVIDYFAGIWIAHSQGTRRKWLLALSLVANIGILAVFKYYNFINENLSHLLGWFHADNPIPYLTILLPIGLSFHTFQAMSYTIEVYRGNQEPERHFGIYSLYVMFYPQLVAGPIERPQNMLHQFREKYNWDWQRFFEGGKWMIWGFFMKLVVADRLSQYVDFTYGNPAEQSGVTLWTGTVFFAFQIYCDFAGYSLIALGSAKIMGFNLMTNFRRPYLSQSISEFWSRWHISLSTWFRDYLYISLGGNRVGKWIKYRNLLVVFVISGLWHGANWTFICWGACNGIFLVLAQMRGDFMPPLENAWKSIPFSRFKTIINWMLTFVIILFTWVFFRATDASEAWLIIQKLIHPTGSLIMQNRTVFYLGCLAIFMLILADFWMEYSFQGKSLAPQFKSKTGEGVFYACVVVVILAIGVLNGGQFIYFQF
jgi:alginate O-acetyltransferase complex protein AlgI